MAATVKAVFKNCQIIKSNSAVLSAFLQKNAMSQYPTYYIKPIPKKEVQDELSRTGEAQKLVHVPTRAALNDQTCSYTQDDTVSLFINYIMRDGDKVLARTLVERSFEHIKRIQLEKYHKCKNEEDKGKIELNPRRIFKQAVENCKPILNLTPIKRGGVRYQVPVPISGKQSQFLSMKWIINAAKEKDHTVRFHYQLARELIDAANNTGRVIKRKQDLHRQCEANRAYAHYRWS